MSTNQVRKPRSDRIRELVTLDIGPSETWPRCNW
jgi:hypothetical protein